MKKENLIVKQDSITGLPILYQTYSELLKFSQQDKPDLNKLKNLLFEDVALCAKALSDINNQDDRKEQVITLDQGLKCLDLEHFLIKALSSPFSYQNSEETIWYKRFNQRSVVSALACRYMGEEMGYQDLEELYLFGLLHDIGILMLKQSFPEEYSLVLERKCNGERLSEVEKEILATDHLEAGGRGVENWDFPKGLKKVIEEHEIVRSKSSGKAGEDNIPSEIVPRIVGVAEEISEIFFVETDPRALEDLSKSWEKGLKLSAGFFKRIYPKLAEEINQRSIYYQSASADLTDMLLQAHTQITTLCQSCEDRLKEKFRNISRKNEEDRKKAELESLRIILATFSHYINNATTSIMGRSQLIDFAIKRGEIKDESGKISSSMKIIQQGVENITSVLNGLKKLDSFRTIKYHERSNIIDLQDKIEIKGL